MPYITSGMVQSPTIFSKDSHFAHPTAYIWRTTFCTVSSASIQFSTSLMHHSHFPPLCTTLILHHSLYHSFCTIPILHISLHHSHFAHLTVPLTFCTPHCTTHILLTSLHHSHFAHLTAPLTFCTPHCTTHIFHTSLYHSHFAHLTAPLTFCTPHCTTHILHTSPHHSHFAHLTAPLTFCTPHRTTHILHTSLHHSHFALTFCMNALHQIAEILACLEGLYSLSSKILPNLEAIRYGFRVVQSLIFDRHLSSSAAKMHVTFQSDTTILTPNLTTSRLHEI